MTAPNHLVGGFTFTGLFGSILGLNILADWKYLIVIGFAALLPDIDHTKRSTKLKGISIALEINMWI